MKMHRKKCFISINKVLFWSQHHRHAGMAAVYMFCLKLTEISKSHFTYVKRECCMKMWHCIKCDDACKCDNACKCDDAQCMQMWKCRQMWQHMKMWQHKCDNVWKCDNINVITYENVTTYEKCDTAWKTSMMCFELEKNDCKQN